MVCVLLAWSELFHGWFPNPDKAGRLRCRDAGCGRRWRIGDTNNINRPRFDQRCSESKRNFCYCVDIREVVGDSHIVLDSDGSVFTAPFARNLAQSDRKIQLNNFASCGGSRRSIKRNEILWGNFKWSWNEAAIWGRRLKGENISLYIAMLNQIARANKLTLKEFAAIWLKIQ